MRFAVLSDIQANLDALAAVLADIDAVEPKIDRIFSTGDVVGRGPHPNEVIDLCEDRGIDAVLGNYDDAVAFDRIGSGADFPTVSAEQDDVRAVQWTKRALTETHMSWLRRVPRDLRLYTGAMGNSIKRNTGDVTLAARERTFLSRFALGTLFSERKPLGPKRIKEVLLVHGSPRALNEFLRHDTADSIASRLAHDARADVVVTGHSGVCFRRDMPSTVMVGAGSLSGAQVQPGTAQYSVVSVQDTLDVEFRSVTYNAERYRRAMQTHGLPLHASPVHAI
ncbi:MAG: metallophosphoesterase family protein [Chloroflexota bacterium]